MAPQPPLLSPGLSKCQEQSPWKTEATTELARTPWWYILVLWTKWSEIKPPNILVHNACLKKSCIRWLWYATSFFNMKRQHRWGNGSNSRAAGAESPGMCPTHPHSGWPIYAGHSRINQGWGHGQGCNSDPGTRWAGRTERPGTRLQLNDASNRPVQDLMGLELLADPFWG